MEHWDPQMMLDLYIHNYLIKKNMHNAAEIFAREANVYPKTVAIDTPEGFLSEWWSLFWSVYAARYPDNTEASEDSSSKATLDVGNVPQDVYPFMPSPDANYMLQNVSLAMQRPGLPNLLQTITPMTKPMPDTGSFLQADLSSMMSRPEMLFPVSDFTMTQEQAIRDLIAARGEQHHARLPVGDLNPSSQLLKVDQLARVLPSSSNSSHLHGKVYNNPQFSFTRDDKCATSLRRFAVDPTRNLPKSIQLEVGLADTGSIMYEKEHLRLPVGNLNSNPPILDVDRIAHLLPSSSNCSHPQDGIYKKLLLSATGDDECGTDLWRPIAAEPYCHPPNYIEFNKEPADTDGGMSEQEFPGLPVGNLNSIAQVLHVDQLAPLLPSSSNCSHPQKNKKRQRSVTGDDKCGASLRRSIDAVATHYAPITTQPTSEPADADAKQSEQRRLMLPVRDFSSNSQLVDVNQLAHLLASSGNYSQPQRNVDKKSQPSLTRDESRDTRLRRSVAKATCDAPKAIQPKPDHANTGSSTSSNSASSDPSSRIQELMPINDGE